jgi:hypothetical protein
MGANEELIDGRDPLVEARERHFEILGTGGADDHFRQIRGIGDAGQRAGSRSEEKLASS